MLKPSKNATIHAFVSFDVGKHEGHALKLLSIVIWKDTKDFVAKEMLLELSHTFQSSCFSLHICKACNQHIKKGTCMESCQTHPSIYGKITIKIV